MSKGKARDWKSVLFHRRGRQHRERSWHWALRSLSITPLPETGSIACHLCARTGDFAKDIFHSFFPPQKQHYCWFCSLFQQKILSIYTQVKVCKANNELLTVSKQKQFYLSIQHTWRNTCLPVFGLSLCLLIVSNLGPNKRCCRSSPRSAWPLRSEHHKWTKSTN